jgi:sugar phosphate isomerase/epimerase
LQDHPMMHRRRFLKTAALAGAGFAFPARAAAAADAMFVSLNSSLTRQMPWTDFAELAARLGYGGVDVNLAAARKERLRPERGAKPPSDSERGWGPASTEDAVDATRTLLTRLKIKPGIASLPVRYSRDEEAYQEDMKQLGDAARFVADIGCPRMMAVLPPSGQSPKPEFRKIIKDRLVAIGETLRRSNVRLGLEFLGPLHFRTRAPHEFIWRMDEALEFSKECGANIGLTLDAWHWHHAGATAADILSAGQSRIVHVHVSDARRQAPEDVRDNQRVMPGEGVIDLVTFFQTLQKTGYTDAVSPEPIGRVPQEMSAEEGARLGLETTRGAMKKAGVI